MTAGFVYSLINPSTPGLVKVGRTERDPQSRAQELTSATGVATPFMLVYFEYFADCAAAEAWVHGQLGSSRVSENREFFRAEVVDVIKAISDCPGKSVHSASGDALDEHDDGGLLTPPASADHLDDLQLTDYRAPNPADEVFERAEAYYYGLEDALQDYAEAKTLYKQAARLGIPEAYYRLGEMYAAGEGVREDKGRAVEFLKEGVRKGEPLCYAAMASIFYSQQHLDNAEKCWVRYLQEAGPRRGTTRLGAWVVDSRLREYLQFVIESRRLPQSRPALVEECRDGIREAVTGLIGAFNKLGMPAPAWCASATRLLDGHWRL